MFSEQELSLFSRINRLADEFGVKVYLVGGLVRDHLLGTFPQDKDIDLLVAGNGIEFAKYCNESLGGEIRQHAQFFTAKIFNLKFEEIEEIDFASAREEIYLKPGALPTVKLAEISSDLKRRDFTINAMAVPLSAVISKSIENEIVDPFGGRLDLTNRTVRVLHERSFIDDPTRIFRAARYAVRISGTLAPQTASLITEALQSKALDSISLHRKYNELKIILSEPGAPQMFRLLQEYGVFEYFELVAPSNLKLLLAALEQLCTVKLNTEQRLEVFGRLIYIYLNPLERESRMTDLAFSKKKLKLYKAELENDSFVAISDEGILARYASSSDIAIKEELHKRGYQVQ